MKNYKGLIAIIIILSIMVVALGIYTFKGKDIIQWYLNEIKNETEQIDLENDFNINQTKTLGTGIKRPSQYKPSEKYYMIDNNKYELETVIDSLKNEELKKEISTFIKESTEKLENKESEFQKYIEEGNKKEKEFNSQGNEYYRVISSKSNSGDTNEQIKIFTEWECTNGYLSISLSYKYAYDDIISGSSSKKQKIFNYGTYETYCATFDLYTGKKLKFSDLFFEGEDYSVELYGFIKSKIASDCLEKYTKREFTTLPQDYQYFTIKSIMFNKQNIYFSEATEILTQYYFKIFPVLTIARNMADIFTNIDIESSNEFGKPTATISNISVNNNTYVVARIKHWDENMENKINNSIIKCAEELDKSGIFDEINKNKMYTATGWQYRYDSEKNKIETTIIQQLNNKEQAIEIVLNAENGKVEELYCREDGTAGIGVDQIVKDSIAKKLDIILKEL